MESSRYLGDVKTLQDKLLRTIEDGDAVDILAEEYCESLNELMKAELIEIRNDKLQLTDKGRHARVIGVADCLRSYPEEKIEKIQLEDFTESLSRDSRNRSLLIVLFFLVLSLVVILILMNFHNILG